MSFLDQIPDYRQAVEAERSNRDLAFVGFPLPLCGILVHQMTPWSYMMLTQCENAFLVGKIPRPDDVAMFLWFLSPAYSLHEKARAKFLRNHIKKAVVRFEASLLEIDSFLEKTFIDAPSLGNRASEKTYVSSLASLIDIFASEYGWTDEQILKTPLARLFQYMRCIQMRHNPTRPMINASEKAISRWLANRNATAAEARVN